MDISTPGSYAIWMRILSGGGSSNSCFVGLNGSQVGSYFDNGSSTGWTWKKHASSCEMAIGPHDFHVRRREDGYAIDRIVLTRDHNFSPSGSGPSESLRDSGNLICLR